MNEYRSKKGLRYSLIGVTIFPDKVRRTASTSIQTVFTSISSRRCCGSRKRTECCEFGRITRSRQASTPGVADGSAGRCFHRINHLQYGPGARAWAGRTWTWMQSATGSCIRGRGNQHDSDLERN
jgi:hypothetical protein